MPPTKQPVFNAAKQWAAQRAQRPPAPPTPLSQIQNNWKRPPLATINPNALMAQPMVSQYPQPQEQGPPPMAQNRLFPRAGQATPLRSPYRMMDAPTYPEQAPMQGDGVDQVIARLQAPNPIGPPRAQRAQMMAGPSTAQRPINRLMGSGGPGIAQATPPLPPNHPLFGLNLDQMRKMVQMQIDKLGSPIPTAQEMGYVPEPVVPPPMTPIGTRRVGGMELSTTNRPGMNTAANNRLPQAGNREAILARENFRGLGGTQTFQQAATDPNFNADGRFFQGAGLGADAQGRPYFRERPQPTDFAGNSQNAEEAGYKRLKSLQALEARGVGYIDPTTGAFVGRDSQRFPSDGNTQGGQVAGRLAAGGVTPSSLTPDQLAANRLGMIQRLADKRQSAMSRVQQLAQQDTAARRERMNPSPLNRLLQNNPQAALAFQAQQNQFNNELAVKRLENEGKVAAQNAENAGVAMKGPWMLAAEGVRGGQPIDKAGRAAGLPQFANAPQAGAVPKFQPGSFGGVNKQTFDYLKETLKDVSNDDDAFSLMGEMGIPQELHAGLLGRAKPNPWWKGPRMNDQKRNADANLGVPDWWPNWLRPTDNDRNLKAGEMAPLAR